MESACVAVGRQRGESARLERLASSARLDAPVCARLGAEEDAEADWACEGSGWVMAGLVGSWEVVGDWEVVGEKFR